MHAFLDELKLINWQNVFDHSVMDRDLVCG